MTQWREFPLRPHGKAWPGLNTKGGRIMTLGGEMSDCTNVVVNQDDVLEKRKGLVRAFDERFGGVVCGLFKYTSHCGVEKIIVADELGFSIRDPFVIPLFQIADCYPFDSFALADGEALSSENWRNIDRYEHQSDAMVLLSTVGALPSLDPDELPILAARWFKDSCSRSYQVRTEYTFDSTAGTQRMFIVIRGNDDLATGAMLLGIVDYGPSPEAKLYYVNAAQEFSLQAQQNLTSGAGGIATLSYDQTTRIPTMTVIPTGGTLSTIVGPQLSVIQDLDFGLVSAIGLAYSGSAPSSDFGILVVDGGSV